MLFTLIVASGGQSYTTQQDVESLRDVIPSLLASQGFRQFAAATMPSTGPSPLVLSDVFLFVPMTGLRNAWLAQGGKNGEYFNVVLVRTSEAIGET
jgi:hypothetical protein